MHAFWQDLRSASRELRKSPLSTATALLSLALGIGANTAVFSLLDQALLRRLPVRQPESLVLLSSPGSHHGWMQTDYSDKYPFSYPEYKDFRDQATVFNGVLARFPTFTSFSWKGQTERGYGDLVSGNYFQALGVGAALGRVILPEDDLKPGAHPVVVLSYSFWQRRFGADPGVLNQSVRINGFPMTVIGVAPRGFNGVGIPEAPQFFVPMMMRSQMSPGRNDLDDQHAMWLNIFARLKPGVSRQQAEAAIQGIWQGRRQLEAKDFKKINAQTRARYVSQKVILEPGGSGINGIPREFQLGIIAMLAMVGLLLLIACANVANLLIARASGRLKEISIRFALGASRWRVMRQMLIESTTLSFLGGLLGLLVAQWTMAGLLNFLPISANTGGFSTGLDVRALWFTFSLAVSTGVVFGLAPALQGASAGVATTLKDSASGVLGGFGQVRFRKLLVSAQVALSLVLLVGAGLFARSLANLRNTDPGFHTHQLVQFSIAPSMNGYSPARATELYTRLQQQISALPGVQSVSASRMALLSRDLSMTGVEIEGKPTETDGGDTVRDDRVGPHYFSTLQIPVLAGREFEANDNAAGAKVAIINQAFAKKYFPGQDPLGRGLIVSEPEKARLEIVGVVRDIKTMELQETPQPYFYVPYLQVPAESPTFYVRSSLEPASLGPALRNLIKREDPNLPIFELKTVDRQIDELVFTDRLLATLAVALALLATLLAAVGLYGVVAFIVGRRTREIGIRVALGARPGRVVRLVFGEILMMGGGGIIVALLVSFVLGRLLNAQLFGIRATDPFTLLTATSVIATVVICAALPIAARAATMDPIRALRQD